MKKTHVSIGLVLSAMLLTACGKTPETKQKLTLPERGEYSFNIELSKTFKGTDEIEAKHNYRSQLKNIVSLEAIQSAYDRYDSLSYDEVTGTASLKFYSNDVCVTSADMQCKSVYGDVVKTTKMTQTETVAVVGNKVIEKRYYGSGSYSSGSVSVDSYNCDDLSEWYELDDLIYSGYFGIDSEGRGVFYYIDYTEYTDTGYDKFGNSIEVFSYDVDETLILFDGDPRTGKPLQLYSQEIEYRYYDDLGYLTEEPIVTDRSVYEYTFKYGKRSEFKNKDVWVENLKQPTFTSPVSPKLRAIPVTLTSDGTAIDTITGTESYPFTLDDYSDPLSADCKTSTGASEGKSITFKKDNAYAIDIETSFVELYESSPDVLSRKHVSLTFVGYTTFEVVNLPESLKVVDHNDEKYIYASEDTRVSIMITYTSVISSNELGYDCETNAVVTFLRF